MPYIKQTRRETINIELSTLLKLDLNEGDLNYTISMLIHNYINKNGLNYANCNNMIGVLECAKLELYRKLISPYEDVKIKENGDL